jgi:hypothetical protein
MWRLKFFVVFLTSSTQMPGYHFSWATTASFQILWSSLFTYHCTIRRLVVQQLTLSLSKPRRWQCLSLLNDVRSLAEWSWIMNSEGSENSRRLFECRSWYSSIRPKRLKKIAIKFIVRISNLRFEKRTCVLPNRKQEPKSCDWDVRVLTYFH